MSDTHDDGGSSVTELDSSITPLTEEQDDDGVPGAVGVASGTPAPTTEPAHAEPARAEPPRVSAPPPLPGWTAAAMAIHAMWRMPAPMVISLQPTGFSALDIDLRGYVYRWGDSIDDLPERPESVAISTWAIDDAEPAFAGDDFRHRKAFEGDDLDPVLWLIGTRAFDGHRATWLRAGDTYRLYRWPYFDDLPITAEQKRIVSTSAKGFMTVEKLAARAKVDEQAAQRVINALSLMGLLRRNAAKDAAPLVPPPPPAGSLPGL